MPHVHHREAIALSDILQWQSALFLLEATVQFVAGYALKHLVKIVAFRCKLGGKSSQNAATFRDRAHMAESVPEEKMRQSERQSHVAHKK